jgi:hypothetical protein
MVEQEDLLNYAGLPFAKAYGPGGVATALTTQAIESHFDRLFRETEQLLAQICSRINVTWRTQRPHGDYFEEIAASLEQGDTVVVSWWELRHAGHLFSEAVRQLLSVAAAVVVPSRRRQSKGPIIVVGGGRVASIAHGIVKMTGAKIESLEPSALMLRHRPAAVIVASLAAIGVMGEEAFLQSLANTGATAVVVSDEIAEPRQPPR